MTVFPYLEIINLSRKPLILFPDFVIFFVCDARLKDKANLLHKDAAQTVGGNFKLVNHVVTLFKRMSQLPISSQYLPHMRKGKVRYNLC